jgi:hypothetical protein
MALVVFLRGVNVGAAGTFVVRKPGSRATNTASKNRFGVPATSRNWNTMLAIVRIVEGSPTIAAAPASRRLPRR